MGSSLDIVLVVDLCVFAFTLYYTYDMYISADNSKVRRCISVSVYLVYDMGTEPNFQMNKLCFPIEWCDASPPSQQQLGNIWRNRNFLWHS